MKAEKIAEMLKGIIRLKRHDKNIEKWSEPGQPNAEFWQKDSRWYIGREEDEKSLENLEKWGILTINEEMYHASFEFQDLCVWYSLSWGWGVCDDKGFDYYRSNDANYYESDIPDISIETVRPSKKFA